VKIEQPSTPLLLLHVTKCGNDAERRARTLHHHNTDIRSLSFSPAAAGPAMHFDPAGTDINSLDQNRFGPGQRSWLKFYVISFDYNHIFVYNFDGMGPRDIIYFASDSTYLINHGDMHAFENTSCVGSASITVCSD
jgi:hypothetical protein